MNHNIHSEEYLDLVNEKDEVIGNASRDEIYKQNLKNFRVISGFIVNDKGQLWIPRRTNNKKIFPNCLDMSVAGHVSSGETYDEAFAKELEEELNLFEKEINYTVIGYLSPFKDGTACFEKVYEIKMNDVPSYNTADFTEYYWLFPSEIIEKINAGDKSKSDLPILIKKFYL